MFKAETLLEEKGFFIQEPAMTYATAIMHPCTAHGNLAAAADRYGTHDDLCSTGMHTY
jgi:hypothetical protein